MQVILGCIYIVVVGGSVDYELDIVRPTRSAVGHVNLLPIVVMVGDGSVEHAKALWCSEISSYHTDVHFGFTWFGISPRGGTCVYRY